MYDLEESNRLHLYENSWNLPREMFGFVSTCMLWRNQIVAICMKRVYTHMILRNQIVVICMKIVEIFKEKWLVLHQHEWFGGSNLSHLYDKSWNRPSENVCFVINWYDLEESNCCHLYQKSWNRPIKKLVLYIHVWFGGIKLLTLVPK